MNKTIDVVFCMTCVGEIQIPFDSSPEDFKKKLYDILPACVYITSVNTRLNAHDSEEYMNDIKEISEKRNGPVKLTTTRVV